MKLVLLFSIIVLNDFGIIDGTAMSSSGSGSETILEKLKQLQKEMTYIANENMDMKLLINQQREQFDDLSKEMDKLKKKVITQEQEIARLNGDRDRYRPTSDSNDDENHVNTDRTKRFMTNNLYQPKQTTNSSDASGSVAFSAMADTVITANANETIPFGWVQMNEGNAYNGTTGLFICPKSGLYLFSYNILSFYSKPYGGKAVGVWLSVNGIPNLITEQNAPGLNLNYNVPGTALVRLSNGDKVSVSSRINGTIVFFMSSYFIGVRALLSVSVCL